MYNEINYIRHKEDEIIKAINNLNELCQDNAERLADLIILTEYIEDMVGLCGYFKEEAEKNAEFVNQVVSAIADASLKARKDSRKEAKKQYLKDFAKIMKAKKNKE